MSQYVAEEGLYDYKEFDWSVINFASQILEQFSRCDDKQMAVYNILKRIAEIYHVHRVTIFLFTKDHTKLQTYIQWHEDDIKSIDPIQKINPQIMFKLFQESDLAEYSKTSNQSDEVCNYFEEINVKASLSYLLKKNKIAFGLISLHDCHNFRNWEIREIELIQIAAMLLQERIPLSQI